MSIFLSALRNGRFVHKSVVKSETCQDLFSVLLWVLCSGSLFSFKVCLGISLIALLDVTFRLDSSTCSSSLVLDMLVRTMFLVDFWLSACPFSSGAVAFLSSAARRKLEGGQ